MELEKLLYLQGIGADYIDCSGKTVAFTTAERISLLRTVSPELFDGEELIPSKVADRVHQLDVAHWLTPLPDWQISTVTEQAVELSLYLPQAIAPHGSLQLITENGQQHEFAVEQLPRRIAGDYRYQDQQYLHWRLRLESASLPLGYHQLQLQLGEQRLQGTWVIAPTQAYTPKPRRGWGLLVQLYSVRSSQNWGIGDFGDLTALCQWAAGFGVDFVQLNPLHGLPLHDETQCSPYRPVDRRFINPLYIDISQVTGYRPQRFAHQQWQTSLAKCRTADWLDYGQLFNLKLAALATLFDSNRGDLNSDFQRYEAESGAALVAFSEQQAQGFDGTLGQPQFHRYLQFIALGQLKRCQQRARAAGMTIGLIGDLPVGVAPDGTEVTTNAELFCHHASIGAPPDPFALSGQNWGLAPMSPMVLGQTHYQHFIELLRRNMASVGALRLDHILLLNRLWWWGPDNRGGYIYYQQSTLLALLCLESLRHRCAVVGEDLGTVSQQLIGELQQANVMSNELLYFFTEGDEFRSPDQCKPNAMVMLANHDVAPMAGWWQGKDLRLRQQLNQLSESQFKLHWQQRQQQRYALLRWLELEHHNSEQWQPQWLVRLMAKFAAGNARFIAIQLDDLCNETEPVNLPGTHLEYPNWRRRLSYSLEQLMAQKGPLMSQLAEAAQHGFMEETDVALF